MGGEPTQAPRTADETPDPWQAASFDETTGALTGVVLDEELVPLAGVGVWLEDPQAFSARTTDTGRFAFSLVPAGPHTLAAQKDGYEITTLRLEVVAGEMASLSVTLKALPVVEPMQRTQEQNGVVGCGVGWRPTIGASNGAALCGSAALNSTTGDRFELYWKLAGNRSDLHGAALEMAWQSTQYLSGSLELRWDPASCIGFTMGKAVGRSPLQIRHNESVLRELQKPDTPGCGFDNCEDPCTLRGRVFPGYDSLGGTYPVDVGVTTTQRFTQYFSEFYLQPLPEGFTALPDV